MNSSVWTPNESVEQTKSPKEPNEVIFWFHDFDFKEKTNGMQLNVYIGKDGKFHYINFHYLYGIYSTCRTSLGCLSCKYCENIKFEQNSFHMLISGMFCHGEGQQRLYKPIPFRIEIIWKKPQDLNTSITLYC